MARDVTHLCSVLFHKMADVIFVLFLKVVGVLLRMLKVVDARFVA